MRFGRSFGASVAMRRLYPLCERLAHARVPVVIEGEAARLRDRTPFEALGVRAGLRLASFGMDKRPIGDRNIAATWISVRGPIGAELMKGERRDARFFLEFAKRAVL